MNRRHGLMMGGLILLGLLTLGAKGESGGCGGSNLFEGMSSKDSREAKIEEAKIALDTRDFTKTIDLLKEFCGESALAPTCDSKTASLWAAGFCGRAGMDTVKLITVAATASVNGFTTAEGLTTFSQIVTSSSPAVLADTRSCTVLMSIKASDPSQQLQLAQAAATDIVALLGSFTKGFTAAGRPENAVTAADMTTIAALISQDLLLVSVGLANSGIPSADLSSALETFKQCLGGASPTGAGLAAALNTLRTSGTCS